MDQNITSVIIALLTGVFSTIALIIGKKQDEVTKKIDEQTIFLEKEKELRQKLNNKQDERESVIHKIMILILDTNIFILQNSSSINEAVAESVRAISNNSDKLKEEFDTVSKEIQDIHDEYKILLDITDSVKKNKIASK